MSQDRLTRHELSWLLAQEARGAARALREGVTQLRQTPVSEPRIIAAPAEAPAVETTLDALDDAITMLSDLNAAGRGKGRRGRIDLAALLMDVAPNTRIAIEPGAGTEVFGDEQDLRRMLSLLVTQAGSAAGGAPEVMIRRQGEWVKISVELGPDAQGAAELERRWLSRMATRHGGLIELEGGTQSIYLPADGASDQREVVELRKELEQAQQLGEAYARELAAVLAAGDVRTEPPPAPTAQSAERFEALQGVAQGLQRAMKSLVDGLKLDAQLAASELGESAALSQQLHRRAAAAAELGHDLTLLTECPSDEAECSVLVSEAIAEAVSEAELRASRHGVAIETRTSAELRVKSRPRRLSVLLRALLQHAISATPKGGRVLVAGYGLETGLMLSVQDGGPSVPEASCLDVLKHRVDPSAFGRPSGVLLSIADAAAESLGGTLEMVEGPEFRVVLPRGRA